ncbi:hypothetical protein TIFTF001_020935 [Ficus carica]|uniref:TMEM205-like domain-containing protein n=1 Tax=Ficus carica TaxID=3494 RepID=A0AA88DJP8_FICCA|nr:hypothetical protein TIFTF001_020935 [Ficus carica]
MMNVVALCLVVTSLATAGVFSPAPKKQNDDDNLIVKEGHRVVVVEYDQEGHPITKVSISPDDTSRHHLHADELSSTAEKTKEKFNEAASVLPDHGEGEWRSPKELICDAYGKCKHKIADAIGRTKEAVSEKVHDVAEKTKEAVSEKAHDVSEKTKETVHDAAEKAKGKAHNVAEKTKETAHDVAEKAKGKARDVAERTKEKVHDAAEKAKGKAHDVVDKAKEAAHEATEKKKKAAQRVEEAAEEAYEKAKETVRSKAHDVEGRARETSEKTWEAAKDGKDLGKTVGKDVANNVSWFFPSLCKQAWERAGVLSHMVSGEVLNPISGATYLVGFSTAYGTAVWVTFILSYVLAGALPRQQFGVVQSKIYPVYFRTMAWGIGTALLGYLLSHRGRVVTSMAEKFQVYNLLASLVLVFVNMLYLEPRATKVMFERMKVEKEEGRGRSGELPAEQQTTAADPAPTTVEAEPPEQEAARNKVILLNGRLKKLNTLSSFLNVLSLMSLSWHVYYLAQRLHMTY